MNKIIHCFITTVISFVLTACCVNLPVHPKCGSSTDSFRINMRMGYDAHGPGTPPNSAKEWVDVRNWQCFLKAKKYGLMDDDMGSTNVYPNNVFDAQTQEATTRFQAAICHGEPLIALTGIVNWATYHKAVAAGMTPYPTIVTPPHARARKTAAVNPIATENIILSKN